MQIAFFNSIVCLLALGIRARGKDIESIVLSIYMSEALGCARLLLLYSQTKALLKCNQTGVLCSICGCMVIYVYT